MIFSGMLDGLYRYGPQAFHIVKFRTHHVNQTVPCNSVVLLLKVRDALISKHCVSIGCELVPLEMHPEFRGNLSKDPDCPVGDYISSRSIHDLSNWMFYTTPILWALSTSFRPILLFCVCFWFTASWMGVVDRATLIVPYNSLTVVIYICGIRMWFKSPTIRQCVENPRRVQPMTTLICVMLFGHSDNFLPTYEESHDGVETMWGVVTTYNMLTIRTIVYGLLYWGWRRWFLDHGMHMLMTELDKYVKLFLSESMDLSTWEKWQQMMLIFFTASAFFLLLDEGCKKFKNTLKIN